MLFNLCNCVPPSALTAGSFCAGGAGFITAVVGAMAAAGKTQPAPTLRGKVPEVDWLGGAYRHRHHHRAVRAGGNTRRFRHRAPRRRQHPPRQAAAHHAARRMGLGHARRIEARRRDPPRADRLRLHAGSAAQQHGDPEGRSRALRRHGLEPRPLRPFRRHGRLPQRRMGPRSSRSCRSMSAARIAFACGAIRAATSARSTARRSWTPTCH